MVGEKKELKKMRHKGRKNRMGRRKEKTGKGRRQKGTKLRRERGCWQTQCCGN